MTQQPPTNLNLAIKKEFKRHLSYTELKKACALQGLNLNATKYLIDGWDTVVVEGGGARVIYNTFNGNFFGTTPEGMEFDSQSAEHDGHDWFQALLNFFYIR